MDGWIFPANMTPKRKMAIDAEAAVGTSAKKARIEAAESDEA
jgi:hypothetical protein